MHKQSKLEPGVRALLLCLALGAGACSPADHEHSPTGSDAGNAAAAAYSNRTPVPPDVRRALGLSFVPVERRAVRESLRVPGRFELRPGARQELHAVAAGRVELLTEPLASVAAGQLVAHIEAPQWRELQLALSVLEQRTRSIGIEIETVQAALRTHEEHHESLEARMNLWRKRIGELDAMMRESASRASELNDARVALHSVEGELAEHHEQVALQQGQKRALEEEARAIEERRALHLKHMAALQGLSAEQLLEVEAGSGVPRWYGLSTIELRASKAGRVEAVATTPGAWLEVGSALLTIVQPEQLWFRAQALESDLGILVEGADALLTPPRWSGIEPGEALAARVRFGVRSTDAQRSVELIFEPTAPSHWARAGVHAFAEVIVKQARYKEIAIPNSCILRDEGRPIFFRRDPKDPDTVIREEADLGFDDGRWTEVLSGLKDGDEVVLDGAFQLLLAATDSVPAGMHVHPDGSVHANDH